MKAKFSVGNRINHYKFGEGMIIQIRNNQMEVLFLDEQRKSFSIDTDEVVLIGTPVFETERKEASLPSASKKIKKELDQLKEGNRTEYFDYELNNQKKTLSLNKNTRVFHTLLGEGMITKILKNEYQIIFLNGEKHNIPINSPDLNLLTNTELSNDNDILIENINKDNKDRNDIFVGKHVNIPNIGEGMVSKIFDDTYDVIFMDGHKQSFILPDKKQNIELTNDIKDIKTESLTAISSSTTHFDENNLYVGKQINHPELGDGMVSKLGESFYEIIFLNGKKHRFEFADRKTTAEINESLNTELEYVELNRKANPVNTSIFQSEELFVGKQINHPELGEGMISKILKDSYEIIFLNGKKQIFAFNEKLNEIENNEVVFDKKLKEESENQRFDINAFELPSKKNQQNSQNIQHEPINSNSQIDDFFIKSVKTEPEKNKNNYVSTNDISAQIEKSTSNNIMLGTAVFHTKHGNGLICNIDEFEIEVVFYNHKKIVYSAKSNELKYLNVR